MRLIIVLLSLVPTVSMAAEWGKWTCNSNCLVEFLPVTRPASVEGLSAVVSFEFYGYDTDANPAGTAWTNQRDNDDTEIKFSSPASKACQASADWLSRRMGTPNGADMSRFILLYPNATDWYVESTGPFGCTWKPIKTWAEIFSCADSDPDEFGTGTACVAE